MKSGNHLALPTAGRDRGSRAPAPGSLRLVQALVNTLNAELGRDLLGTTADATRWLEAGGLLAADSPLTRAEHGALVELREAIRQVLGTHTEGRADAEAARRLSVALACSRLAPAIDPAGGVALVSADHDPFARPLPDPVGYGTVPLAGFRVRALPGSAAEAEERQAEAATRRAIPALTRVGRHRLESTPDGGSRWLPVERADRRSRRSA